MQLRDYQQAAIGALYGYFMRASGNPLLVLPTGSGKSLVNAALVKGIIESWPGQRVLCLTHVKELIVQNYLELIAIWPEAPAGVNSASVGRRDTLQPIIFAGIQSVYKQAMELGWFDLIIVDEAHLIPAKAGGMYRVFLDAVIAINPAIKVVGLTATPYRLGQGVLTEGDDRLFTDIAYEVPIRLLLDRGYLSALTTPVNGTEAKVNLAGVGTRGGEFIPAQMAEAVDRDDLTQAAVAEIIRHGVDRKSWLVFCSSVAHAEHVSDALNAHGVMCNVVTGNTPKGERQRTIQNFKDGHLKALANVDVLTTGFNAPNTDLLALLRPTQSPGLYLQMVGRGMRQSPATGKTDCLVLDFAGNIERHGPVDDVRPPRAPGAKRSAGDSAMVKVCMPCGAEAHISARYCPVCLAEFPVNPVHEDTASNAAIVSTGEKESPIVAHEVTSVSYCLHIPKGEGKQPSFRVDYYAGYERACSEWVCFEHDGYARKKAENWWRERMLAPVPVSIEEALLFAEADLLPSPETIHVDASQKFPAIVGYDYGDLDLPVEAEKPEARPAFADDFEFTDDAPF